MVSHNHSLHGSTDPQLMPFIASKKRFKVHVRGGCEPAETLNSSNSYLFASLDEAMERGFFRMCTVCNPLQRHFLQPLLTLGS